MRMWMPHTAACRSGLSRTNGLLLGEASVQHTKSRFVHARGAMLHIATFHACFWRAPLQRS